MTEQSTAGSVDQSILQEAHELVYGPRAAAYGSPYDNFNLTAELWSPILGIPVSGRQVAMCMAQLKIARELHKPARDNRVDAAGYIATLDRYDTEAQDRESFE